MPNFSFLVCLEVVFVETEKETKKQNSVKLEASLAPAEAEVGAVAKAYQKSKKGNFRKRFYSYNKMAKITLASFRL